MSPVDLSLGIIPGIPTVAPFLPALLTALAAAATAVLARSGGKLRLLRVIARQWRGLLVWGVVCSLVWWCYGLWRRDPLLAPQDFSTGASRHIEWEPWPTFLANASRSGYNESHPNQDNPTVQWQAARDYVFDSSPLVTDRHVVCVGHKGDRSRVFCWELFTGRPVWTVTPPDMPASFSSLVTDGRWLVCGEGLHHVNNARLHIIDLDNPAGPRWHSSLATHGHIESTPILDNGFAYFNAGDDGVYCVELPRDSASRPSVKWHVSGDKCPDVETALSLSGHWLLVGLGFGGEALIAIDARTGEIQNRVPLSQPLFAPPALIKDHVILGLGRATFAKLALGEPGELCCFDAVTFEKRWSRPTPSPLLTAPVISNDTVYATTVGGDLIAVSLKGDMIFEIKVGTTVLAPPLVKHDIIHCIGSDGVLHRFDRKTGKRFAGIPIGQPGSYLSSPVLIKGRIVLGTPSNGVVCIGDSLDEFEAALLQER